MMSISPLSFFSAALVMASAAAQDHHPDTTASPSRSECTMQSLQALTSDTIYQRQPLVASDGKGASAPGTIADRRFARIHDACFDRDGRLIELIVELPDDAARSATTRRLLKAEEATWDEVTKRWLTKDANLVFSALPEVPKPDADDGAGQKSELPRKHAEKKTMLASVLELAAVEIDATKPTGAEVPAIEASMPKTDKVPAILWFVPSDGRIAFAVVPHESRFLPLPWPMVRVADGSGGVRMTAGLDAVQLAEAPVCKKATELPSRELRMRCYEHYHVDCPKWDRSPDDAGHQEPVTKREGGSRNR